VSIDSKRPKVIYFGCQSFTKKLITNSKIPSQTFDIHKLELAVAE
jgi:hypothetical protein